MRKLLLAVVMLFVGATLSPTAANAAKAPPAPNNLSVETTKGAATLSWDASPGVGGYNVYRNGGYLTTVSGSSYRDDNSPGVYTYYVTAFDSTEQSHSPRSNELQADTRGTSETEAGPNGNSRSTNQSSTPEKPMITGSVSGRTVTIAWTSNAATLAMNIYRDNIYLATVRNGTTYTDTSMRARHTYYAVGVDSTGQVFSPKSNAVTIVAVAGAPTNVRTEIAEDGSVSLTYDSTAVDVSLFRIYRVEPGKTVGRRIGTSPSLRYRDVGAMYGFGYYVRAVYPNGVEGPASMTVQPDYSTAVATIATRKHSRPSTKNWPPNPPPLGGEDPLQPSPDYDMYTSLRDVIIAAVEWVEDFIESKMDPGPTLGDQIYEQSADRLAKDGYVRTDRDGSTVIYSGPGGSTATITRVDEDTVTTVVSIPHGVEIAKPGVQEETTISLHGDGTKEQFTERKQYDYDNRGKIVSYTARRYHNGWLAGTTQIKWGANKVTKDETNADGSKTETISFPDDGRQVINTYDHNGNHIGTTFKDDGRYNNGENSLTRTGEGGIEPYCGSCEGNTGSYAEVGNSGLSGAAG